MKDFILAPLLATLFCQFYTLSEVMSYSDEDEIVWTRDMTLGEGFNVKFNNEDPDWLVMEISAPTRGYVSVGFSPNGGMKGSDIFMGWVDTSGNPFYKDLYAIGNSIPLEDKTNNYDLLKAKQTESGTTFRFRRRWNTCDTEHDLEITEDTVRMIWAYGEYDPRTNDDLFQPAYHDTFRGVRSVFLKVPTHLMEFPDNLNPPDPKIRFWDVRMDKIHIPREDTVYYCKIIKVPAIESKHQIIGFRALIEEANKNNVHHINFFECSVPPAHGKSETIFEKYVTHPGGYCYTRNMPPEWAQYCITVPFVWVAGSEGLMLPDHVGIPMGEVHNGTTYFMLEIHYDNPRKLTFEDSSGIRLFVTDKVRENDAASITIHARFSQMHMIPPEAKNFYTMAFCTPECTNKAIPPEGITVTHATLHAHLAAKEIIIRHIRNGQELPPIAKDFHYDFNYQQSRVVVPPRKILPGDIVLTECVYDTTDRNQITYGGTSTRDEMCQGYIHYYPRVNLAACTTQPEFYNFFDALGIRKVAGQSALDEVQLPYTPVENQLYDPGDDVYILKNHAGGPAYLFDLISVADPVYGHNVTVREYVNSLKWAEKDGALTKKVWKQWWDGQQLSLCTGPGFARVPLKDYLVSYPKFKPYVPMSEEKCRLQSSGSETIRNHRNIFPLIVFTSLVANLFFF